MDHFTPNLIAAIGVIPLFALLLGAAWRDVESHRIPNRLVFFGIGLGLLLNSMLPEGYGFISSLPGASGFWKALAGLGLGLVIMLPMYVLRALGAGDVKLMAMVGAFLGPNATIGAILSTFIVGGILTLLVVALNRTPRLFAKNLRETFMGALIKATVFHELPKVDAATVAAGKLPYAVAIALGTVLYAVLEQGGRMNFLKFF